LNSTPNKILGDLYVELRKIDMAVAVYKSLIKLSEEKDKFKEQMLMFEQMGY